MYGSDLGVEREAVATALRRYGADTGSELFASHLESSYPAPGSLAVMLATLGQHA